MTSLIAFVRVLPASWMERVKVIRPSRKMLMSVVFAPMSTTATVPVGLPPSASETGVLPAIELSENEQMVYDALNHEESSIDEVIRSSHLPSSAVSVALLSLEMKRLIRQLPGKMFVKNR